MTSWCHVTSWHHILIYFLAFLPYVRRSPAAANGPRCASPFILHTFRSVSPPHDYELRTHPRYCQVNFWVRTSNSSAVGELTDTQTDRHDRFYILDRWRGREKYNVLRIFQLWSLPLHFETGKKIDFSVILMTHPVMEILVQSASWDFPDTVLLSSNLGNWKGKNHQTYSHTIYPGDLLKSIHILSAMKMQQEVWSTCNFKWTVLSRRLVVKEPGPDFGFGLRKFRVPLKHYIFWMLMWSW